MKIVSVAAAVIALLVGGGFMFFHVKPVQAKNERLAAQVASTRNNTVEIEADIVRLKSEELKSAISPAKSMNDLSLGVERAVKWMESNQLNVDVKDVSSDGRTVEFDVIPNSGLFGLYQAVKGLPKAVGFTMKVNKMEVFGTGKKLDHAQITIQLSKKDSKGVIE